MPLHHTASPICPLCDEKLKTADARIAKWFRQIKSEFPDLHISCAYRGKKEQEEAVAGGKSRAHFPMSKHNHTTETGVPCSLALDVFQLKDHAAWFDKAYFKSISEHEITRNAGILCRWDV